MNATQTNTTAGVSLDKTPISMVNGYVRATINAGLRRNSYPALQAEFRRLVTR
jgi:hypothetical protein